MLSVSLVRCKNEALKILYFKSIIKCFNRVKIDKWPDSPCTHFPHSLYCVRRNALPARLFSHRFLDSDCTNFKTFAFLAVYWPLWASLYSTDIKVQQFFQSLLHDVKQDISCNHSMCPFIPILVTLIILLTLSPDNFWKDQASALKVAISHEKGELKYCVEIQDGLIIPS